MLLKYKIDDIDPCLRASTSIEPLLRAFDKDFIFCENYPKVHGEVFHPCMKENHQEGFLLFVERALGSRQDLVVEGSGVVYWNHPCCIEILDDCLRLTGNNILQYNLFVVLYLLQIVTLTPLLYIIHLLICLPI